LAGQVFQVGIFFLVVILVSSLALAHTIPAEAATWNVKATGDGYYRTVPFTATGTFSFSGDNTVSGSGTGTVSYNWSGYDDSGYLYCNISGSSSTSYSVSGSTTSDGKLSYTLSGASPSTIPVTVSCGGAVIYEPNDNYPNPFNFGSMEIEKTWTWSTNTNSFTNGHVNWRFDYEGGQQAVEELPKQPGTEETETLPEPEPEPEQTVEAYYDEYKKKAMQYLKDGNFKSAKTYFEKLIGLAPNDYFGWYGRGISFSALGQYSQAIDSLNEALNRDPTKYNVWKAGGDVFYKLNDCDNAYKYYSNAVKYGPTNSGLVAYQIIAEKCVEQQKLVLVEPVSVDSDGDGIPDNVDQCPKSKETKNLFEDKDGCPDVPPIRSYNIKPGERYINPEQVKVTGLGWVIAKGSDIMTATIEYISPDNVKMKCPQGCTTQQMDRLNRITMKNLGGDFEPSIENILDSTKLASLKAAKGKITTIGAHSKFLIKTLPEHTSETEAQTWHVLLTGHLAVLDTKTQFFIETDEEGTWVYVLEDSVNVFYQDSTKPILISANEYAFASEERFEKVAFTPSSVDKWWEEPSKEIENIFDVYPSEVNTKQSVTSDKKIFENCPKPTVTDWYDGYALVWAKDSPSGEKDAKGIKIGFKDFDGQISNLKIDCDSKTLTVQLDGSNMKSMIGEMYVIENSKKNHHKANLAAGSMSISVDGKDANYQLLKSTSSSDNTEFQFLVLGGTKTLTISNLGLIPEPLQKTESIVDSTPKVKEKVPGWIKNNAKWWAEGQIGDSDFTSGIQFMIKEKIINIPDLPEEVTQMELKDEKRAMGMEREQNVPDWIRNNAGWWADGQISEDDFVNGIKYLVEKGIILV